MLTIRLQRTGKKNQPYFRVVLIEHSHKVGGVYKEVLGFRNPRTKEISLKKDRIHYWLSHGVKASPTVHNLFVSHGVVEGPKVKAWRPKKKSSEALSKEAGEKAKPVESTQVPAAAESTENKPEEKGASNEASTQAAESV